MGMGLGLGLGLGLAGEDSASTSMASSLALAFFLGLGEEPSAFFLTVFFLVPFPSFRTISSPLASDSDWAPPSEPEESLGDPSSDEEAWKSSSKDIIRDYLGGYLEYITDLLRCLHRRLF